MKNIICFIIYCLFICVVIILADTGRLPLHILGYIPFYDKAAHFVLYGVFYTLLNSILTGKRIYIFHKSVSLSFLLISLFMIGEEVSQIFMVSRTFSPADLFMGFAGVLLFRRWSGTVKKVNPAGAYNPKSLPPLSTEF